MVPVVLLKTVQTKIVRFTYKTIMYLSLLHTKIRELTKIYLKYGINSITELQFQHTRVKERERVGNT